MAIERSAGLAVGGYAVGGGYSGATDELDTAVVRSAHLMEESFGRDVDIRFNSNRRSGGAWIRDHVEGFGQRSSQVGLNSYLEVDRSHPDYDDHRAPVPYTGRVVHRAYIDTSVLRDDFSYDAHQADLSAVGASSHLYVPFGSVEDALEFIVRNVDRSRLAD